MSLRHILFDIPTYKFANTKLCRSCRLRVVWEVGSNVAKWPTGSAFRLADCSYRNGNFKSQFYVRGSVHRESMSVIVQQDATIQGVTGGTEQTSGGCSLC